MPSLLDNSPNTVAECIQHSIPFVSTNVGGVPELIAEVDRARVLVEPTARALAERLRTAVSTKFAPAGAANSPEESTNAWLELVESIEPMQRRSGRRPMGVSIVASGEKSATCARTLSSATKAVDVEVVQSASRDEGLKQTAGEWVIFLDDDDEPDNGFVDALVDAQAASNADVVTAAVRLEAGRVQLFLGDPGSLGLAANYYGVVGLVRSELAAGDSLADEGPDRDWPLFARLALAGARIVSIPEPLSSQASDPGRIDDVPGAGLSVLEAFEVARDLPDLPQLAATLAAAYARASEREHGVVAAREGRVAALARRAKSRRG